MRTGTKMSSGYADNRVDDKFLQFCAEHGIAHLRFRSLGKREALFTADGIIHYLLDDARSCTARQLIFDLVHVFPIKFIERLIEVGTYIPWKLPILFIRTAPLSCGLRARKVYGHAKYA